MHLSLTSGLSLSSPNPRAIGCLLELHSPQGLLIVRVIASGGLKVRRSTEVDPDILEYLGKEATIREYSYHALNVRDHMHHHQISHVNPSPCQNRVRNESLKVGDLVSMSSSWQLDGADHVMKDSNGHDQAVWRWFSHPLGICESSQPLNNLSKLESWYSGPRLGLINMESNRRNVENATYALGTQTDPNASHSG